MKYKNYEILRYDERNWTLTRYDDVLAEKDHKNPKTGEITRKKGEKYTKEVKMGYYGEAATAMKAIIKDSLGRDCKDLVDLRGQIAELRADLNQLRELS